MNEDNKFGLLNKPVTLYMDGGFEWTGIVVYETPTIFVLDMNGRHMVVYRNKVSGAELLHEINLEDESDLVLDSRYQVAPGRVTAEEDLAYNHYGSIIPEDMLKGSKTKKNQVDFSVNLQQLKNIKEV